jgi:hypothetical protein
MGIVCVCLKLNDAFCEHAFTNAIYPSVIGSDFYSLDLKLMRFFPDKSCHPDDYAKLA